MTLPENNATPSQQPFRIQYGFHWKNIAIFFVCFIVLTLLSNQPSNTRNWEVGFEKLPHITEQGSVVTIENFRDFRYALDRFVSASYTTRTIDTSNIERAWFIVEPFSGSGFFHFDGIAHTYFMFDVADQKPVGLSVEARREKGEQFSLLSGMTNQFELMYVWASEEDLTQRRVLVEHNQLSMFPLQISKESARRLFLQLVHTSQDLEIHPRFYNTLFSNCTNELAKNANEVKPGSIPYTPAWIFPGYALDELYKLHYIPFNAPLSEIKNTYAISQRVQDTYQSNQFSKDLRSVLPQ